LGNFCYEISHGGVFGDTEEGRLKGVFIESGDALCPKVQLQVDEVGVIVFKVLVLFLLLESQGFERVNLELVEGSVFLAGVCVLHEAIDDVVRSEATVMNASVDFKFIDGQFEKFGKGVELPIHPEGVGLFVVDNFELHFLGFLISFNLLNFLKIEVKFNVLAEVLVNEVVSHFVNIDVVLLSI